MSKVVFECKHPSHIKPKSRPFKAKDCECTFLIAYLKEGGYSYFRLKYKDITYDVPSDFGREPICTLCKHQLDCLGGSRDVNNFVPLDE